MSKVTQVKQYVKTQGIKYDVGLMDYWYIPYQNMSDTQQDHILDTYFPDCIFATMQGIWIVF